MHAKTTPRPEPYVWVTWLAKLLSGEASCTWSAWFRAHHFAAKSDKIDGDFDLSLWQLDHTALIRRTAAEFEGKGFSTITIENQNQFTLAGKVGILAGRPDLLVVQGDEGWIIDAKTGQPRASDRIQLMLYQWALPLTNPAYAKVKFRGRVEYKCRFGVIEPEEVDAAFAARVAELMREVCGPDPPRKSPSYRECSYCSLTPDDCSDRVETEVVHAGVTSEF